MLYLKISSLNYFIKVSFLTLYISNKENEIINASNKEKKLLTDIDSLVSKLNDKDDKDKIVEELNSKINELKSNNNPYNFNFLDDLLDPLKTKKFSRRIKEKKEDEANE